MMTRRGITIVAIVARNGAIGRNGDQPFHISEDFKHFKALTQGKPVVMGRRTFEALPGGALPKRRNIVVTRNVDWTAPGAERAGSLEEAIGMCGAGDEVMIIGGGEVYREAMGLATRLEITRVDADVADADTFFPDIAPEEWRVSVKGERKVDPRTGVEFCFLTYVKNICGYREE